MKLVRPFIDLCLFKASPADVPVSSWLLRLTLIAYFAIDVAIGLVDSSRLTSVVSALADTGVMIAFLWLLLYFRGKLNRYQQSLTALAGAGCCLGLIGIPVMLLLNQVAVEKQMTSYVILLVIGLMFWSLMVIAHIFRQSLDIKPGTAAGLTIAYTILSLIVVTLVSSGVA